MAQLPIRSTAASSIIPSILLEGGPHEPSLRSHPSLPYRGHVTRDSILVPTV